jgi:hypothetical protein
MFQKYLNISHIDDAFKSPNIQFAKALRICILNSKHMAPLKESIEANNSLKMQMNTAVNLLRKTK